MLRLAKKDVLPNCSPRTIFFKGELRFLAPTASSTFSSDELDQRAAFDIHVLSGSVHEVLAF